MTPNAKAKLEIYEKRILTILKEVVTYHKEVELLCDRGEITSEEFDSFAARPLLFLKKFS